MSSSIIKNNTPQHHLIRYKRILCKVDGCTTIACFGENTNKKRKATHCAYHGKLLQYVDVANKKCKQDGCEKRPTYAQPNTKKLLYCAFHGKMNGCVGVANKRCQHEDCLKYASYGQEGVRKAPTHCAKHGKKHGYVNILLKKKTNKADEDVGTKSDLYHS